MTSTVSPEMSEMSLMNIIGGDITNRRAFFIRQFTSSLITGILAIAAGTWLVWPLCAMLVLRSEEEVNSRCQVKMDLNQMYAAYDLVHLGSIISPIPFSYLLNWMGRKGCLLSSAVFYVIASIMVLSTRHMWAPYTAMLFVGLGNGVCYSLMPLYISEVAGVRDRGSLVSTFPAFIGVGATLVVTMRKFVTYYYLNWTCLMPAAMFLVAFPFLPETPYFLLMKGKEKSAQEALAWFRAVPLNKIKHDFPFQRKFEELRRDLEGASSTGNGLKDLFLKKNRKATITACSLMIFQQWTGLYPVYAYYVVPNLAKIHIDWLVLFAFSLLIGRIITIPLSDCMGRRSLLIVSGISTAVILMSLGICFLLDREIFRNTFWLPYTLFLGFSACHSIGLTTVPYIVPSEMFPFRLRGYGTSIATLVKAASLYTAGKTFYIVTDKIGVSYMLFIFSVFAIMTVFFGIFYMIETRYKSFAEIQNSLHPP